MALRKKKNFQGTVNTKGEDVGCDGNQDLKEHTMTRLSSSREKLVHVIRHKEHSRGI